MSDRIPRTVAHYAKDDPTRKVGGVATFARNLELIFERVVFMTPQKRDFDWVRRERVPVICDNHWAMDLPEQIPVIGFQHGAAIEKFGVTHSFADLRLAAKQRRVARRANTLWVACAQWISEAFGRRHGNAARHVIYHQVDLGRFDGKLDNAASRLVLHDARSEHKGSRQLPWLKEGLPEWDLQPLACSPHEVPERMARAGAFIHLSRYEGNSIVCNEAMAQNLPCLFTKVGLFRDASAPSDVEVLDPKRAFTDREWLVERARAFLESLGRRRCEPRRWVEEHASIEANRVAWQTVLNDFDGMGWG